MANMTFKANLLPNTDLGYSLGSSDLKWKLYGDQYQEFDYISTSQNNEYNVTTYIIKLISEGYKGGWFWCQADEGRGCPTEDSSQGYQISWQTNVVGNGVNLTASLYGSDYFYKGLLWKNSTGLPSWSRLLSLTAADGLYVNVTGDTMTGPLHINNTTDVGQNQNGALVIGPKTGENIGIDNNEIMARNNSAVSTLYLNSEGGPVHTTWLRVVNNSSNNTDDAMVYLENKNNSDWAQKIQIGTYNYGMYISGTGTNLLKVGDNNTLYIGNADAQVNGTILKITNNSNTLSIGSQNSTYTHIYNSANIPFIFNNDVNVTDKHWLGSTSYPWGGLRLGGSAPSIQYQGTKANVAMIQMIDNTSDGNGNGIRIGGGGLVIIGGGESSSTLQNRLGYTGGSEVTVIGSDGSILFYPGQDSYDASAQLSMTASRFWAGVNGNTAREAQVGVQSGAGQLYMWSHAATTGSRGLYSPAHGSGSARALVMIDTNNRVYFADSYTGTNTALAYSQAALAASAFTYFTCWNGYELRALTKAEAANALDSIHKWIRVGGDTMTGNLTFSDANIGIRRAGRSTSWIGGRDGALVKTTTISGYSPAISIKTTSGSWEIGAYNNSSFQETLIFSYATDSNYSAGTNSTMQRVIRSNGTTNLIADTAGAWATARTLTIGATGKSVNGTANVSWSKAEILGSSSSAYFYRGDQTWSNTLGNEIISTAANSFRLSYGSGTTKSILLRNDGSNFYILCCNAAGAGNNWYTPTGGGHPFRINLETGYVYTTRTYGAVWNDYAEMRNIPEEIEPGRCVKEIGDGTMAITTERLQRGCKVVSDTFGFNIGETENCKTPIAVSGRALVYIYEGREEASKYIGWPVCSGPNGTVSIMTEEEEEKYPSRIVGTISEIPNYEEWVTGKVKVNGRIWIYVK